MATIEAYGITYSAGDVQINLLGRTLVGVSKIKYGTKQKKENLYGMGREPISRGLGNRTYEGNITLKAWELDAIEKAATDANSNALGDISQIKPFIITVSYFDADSNMIKTDKLKFVEFTGETREVKGGETDIDIDCELMIGTIERNA